jgi:predicted GNAT family acetyltransferase
VRIELEKTSDKGRYFIRTGDPDVGQAELTFSKLGGKTIVANHTEVPVRHRGQGIGRTLVKRLVQDARTNDVKIIPSCPFVRAMFEQHPEWSDVLQVPT